MADLPLSLRLASTHSMLFQVRRCQQWKKITTKNNLTMEDLHLSLRHVSTH
ncbi:hypothetical protein F2Q68_00036416 [Brassica cretica]|uniref:Uncharacterized protein n=1 Tax=Brassica cretica TaxID=69181 RepID=A0A8S9H1Q3_BRACR|nr:hypothetical protein F2Q68_00036416 [Brassica cretica]